MSYDDQLEVALADLADGCRYAADVARKLVAADCRGKRDSTCSCPVSTWLAQRITIQPGEEISVGIDNAEVLRIRERPTWMQETLGVALVPAVIASFIVAFDHEDGFPDLEARSPQPVS